MTPDILLVLGILAVVMVILITELMPLEVLALLVLGVLALTGLVTPTEALSGFSNPAVVTIWAVFILSGGLTRTGIATILGRYLLKVAGSGQARMIMLIMLISGVLSAFMNNVAVAALMLPVIMDISKKTAMPPSQTLMPLAYGSLLGGLTTMIGTPPNILVSEALRTNGLEPFRLFDFTPVGLIVMISGILFVTFIGTRLLPRQIPTDRPAAGDVQASSHYRMQERLFTISVPRASALAGLTLAASRLGSRLGLHVVGIKRGQRTILAPDRDQVIAAEDILIVAGRLERTREMNNWGQLLARSDEVEQVSLTAPGMAVAELRLGPDSPWAGQSPAALDFRSRYGLTVLAINRGERRLRESLREIPLHPGDLVTVHGPVEQVEALSSQPGIEGVTELDEAGIRARGLEEHLSLFSVAPRSRLIGQTLARSGLGSHFDIQILAVVRENELLPPSADIVFEPQDRLLVTGVSDLVAILLMQGLEAVFAEESELEDISLLEDERVGMVEAILSPHSVLSGQSLREISFREKYGLSVLAIWRKGRAIRTGLGELRLQLGDALLLYGSWEKLALLGREPDFIVLTDQVREPAREDKAKTALAIMGAVLLPVLLGWVPIYIAVVIGAAVMVLSKCLTMEEAYRFIEWKAVFLIAGMLPLGAALDQTGAAALVAEQTIGLLGPFGPYGVLFGLLVITFMATSIIPTAALVVLMVPIALQTSAGLGISPYPFMMGIAMAASSSFTSPISHPANVLVMGPGGYKFLDYVKVGVPLTLLILALLMVVIPVFWPMTPL